MAIAALDIDPFDDANLADPFAMHAALRDAGPVVRLPAIGAWGIARYAEVRDALTNWQAFVSGRGVGLGDFAREEPWRPPSLLLEADPPLHDRTRGLMNRIATLSSIRQAMPEWRQVAGAMVERLAERRRIDAVPELAQAFPLAVFPRLIGIRDGGGAHLLAYAFNAFNAFGPRNAVLARSMAAAVEATAWVAESCRRENLAPGGWGMAVYDAADAGECSHDEAERLVRSFLTAGVDTTVNGIGNLLYALAMHPGEWQRLRADPSLARRAFEESLRWNGTVQTFFRTTSYDVEVAGQVIPEGEKVLLFLAAANRDPRHWPDAERFDITRSASGHVGFGFGIHQCLGQMVARMEALAVLEALIPRIAEIRICGPVSRPLNNTLHPIGSLPVELIAA